MMKKRGSRLQQRRVEPFQSQSNKSHRDATGSLSNDIYKHMKLLYPAWTTGPSKSEVSTLIRSSSSSISLEVLNITCRPRTLSWKCRCPIWDFLHAGSYPGVTGAIHVLRSVHLWWQSLGISCHSTAVLSHYVLGAKECRNQWRRGE